MDGIVPPGYQIVVRVCEKAPEDKLAGVAPNVTVCPFCSQPLKDHLGYLFPTAAPRDLRGIPRGS